MLRSHKECGVYTHKIFILFIYLFILLLFLYFMKKRTLLVNRITLIQYLIFFTIHYIN